MPVDPNDRFGLLDQLYVVPVSIAIGGTISNTILCGGAKFIGFRGPVSWTPAVLTLLCSTFNQATGHIFCQQSGVQVDIAANAAMTPQKIVLFHNGLVDGLFQDFPFYNIILQSGTTAAPVVQVGGADFLVLLSAPYGLPLR